MDGMPPVVRLNVGGREYLVARSTLQTVADSMLEKMVTGSISSATVDGTYFIDRDGELFAYVIEYLRDRIVELPASQEVLNRLKREANFFCLPGLEQLVERQLRQFRRLHIHVALHKHRFDCAKDRCNCGDGSAVRDEESDDDDDENDDEQEVVIAFPPKMFDPPTFGSPFATLHLVVKTTSDENSNSKLCEKSMHKACTSILNAMAVGGALESLEVLLSEAKHKLPSGIGDTLWMMLACFFRNPGLETIERSTRTMRYEVGDVYDSRHRFHHYHNLVRISMEKVSPPQAKRRRVD